MDNASRNAIIDALGANLAKRDLEQARAWLVEVPSSDRASATGGVVRTWAKRDIEGVIDWLNNLPDSPERTTGVRAFVQEIKDTDPAMANAWLESIEEKE
jgi:hypothetical protein